MAQPQTESDGWPGRDPLPPALLPLMRRSGPYWTDADRLLLLEYLAPLILKHAVRALWARRVPAALEDAKQIVQQFLGVSLRDIVDGYDPARSPDRTILPLVWRYFTRELGHEIRRIGTYRRYVKSMPTDDEGNVAMDVAGPEADSDLAGQLEDLEKALDELSPADRKMIEAVDLEGMSLKEYGDWLEIAYGAAKTRHSRALEKLRQLMTRPAAEPQSLPTPQAPVAPEAEEESQ